MIPVRRAAPPSVWRGTRGARFQVPGVVGATPSTELQDVSPMPGYAEADLIQARKPIKDQAGRDLAFCNLGHLETEQREAATSDRAELIRALQVNIATFDGVEPETEATQTDPDPEPTAGVPSPAALPTPPTPSPAPVAADTRELGRASMLRTLARAGITPVGGQQAPVGASGGISTATSSMHRTLARMGVQPTREA